MHDDMVFHALHPLAEVITMELKLEPYELQACPPPPWKKPTLLLDVFSSVGAILMITLNTLQIQIP